MRCFFVTNTAQHSGTARPAAIDHSPQRLIFSKDDIGLVEDEARGPKLDGAKESGLTDLNTKQPAWHQKHDQAKQRGLATVTLGRRGSQNWRVRRRSIVNPSGHDPQRNDGACMIVE